MANEQNMTASAAQIDENELRRVRKEKLQQLQAQGKDPFAIV